MMTTPRFLQGAFAFEGHGLAKPSLLHPSLAYTVPEGTVVLVFDGVPARWLDCGLVEV